MSRDNESEMTESQEFKSKLFIVNEFLDPVDDLDRQWTTKFSQINAMIQNLSENDIVTKLQNHISERVENYTETFSALLYGYLTCENSPQLVGENFDSF